MSIEPSCLNNWFSAGHVFGRAEKHRKSWASTPEDSDPDFSASFGSAAVIGTIGILTLQISWTVEAAARVDLARIRIGSAGFQPARTKAAPRHVGATNRATLGEQNVLHGRKRQPT